MPTDAHLPESGPPAEPTPITLTSEPALIDLSAPRPAPQTPEAVRYLRAVIVPSAPGRVAYGLAWLCVLALVATAIVFTHLTGDHWGALTIVLSAVGVAAAVCLHLAAISVNRRRDLGYSIFAACLIVVLVLPAAYVTFMMASFGAASSTAFGGDGGDGAESSFSPDSGSDVSPTESGNVACEAPDGSTIEVEPELCVDGQYTP
ncbi:hypothetical protein [Krasilnikovia sp. M28-CT-15]|uniref:hypothetical protein n=1 Tax=Krasilnikovia sp. M28-CT-15 TaxID=3373540 RepID=UPI00387639E9